MNFVRFQEHNDHEGETWNFWLQLDGNELELEKLSNFLQNYNIESFELDIEPVLESTVDILIKYGGSGYTDFHNKVIGKFTMPEIPPEDERNYDFWVDEFLSDQFYKGDITCHFKNDQ